MFNLFKKTPEKTLKGYKITSVDRKQKYGIAANSLKMLIDKAAAKFKVNYSVFVVFQWNWDGWLLFDVQG